MTPKGWISARLDELLISDSPGFWGEAPDGVNEIAVLRATNLRKYGIGLDFSDLAYRSFPERKLNEKRLRPGDILLERSGGGPQQPVGRVALFEHDGTYSYSNFMQRLRVDANKCIDKYVVYRLSYLHSQGETARLQQATTGIRNLQYKDYLALVHPIPPLPEQRKIAAILSAVDAVIERTQAVIDQLQQVKKALMQELLTRGIPGRHTRFKQTEIGEVPEGWDVVPLSRIATLERGRFSHRPRNDPRFFGGSIPFIQTGDIAASNGRLTHHSQSLNEDGLRVSRIFPAGTIIITIAANIGDTAIATFPVAFPDSLVGIQCGHRINNRFLELVLQTRKSQLEENAPQNAQKNINLEILKPLLIPVPLIDEQHIIADCIEAIEVRARTERRLLEAHTVAKTALMSVLLSGEVRVKVEEGAA